MQTDAKTNTDAKTTGETENDTVNARAREYARIERQSGDAMSDPKVKAMTRARGEVPRKVERYLDIERRSED